LPIAVWGLLFGGFMVYQQYPAQQQQNPYGMQYGLKPQKPPSTKVEGFLLMHFSGIINLTTTEQNNPEIPPVITLYILAPFLNASTSIGSLSMPTEYGDATNPYNIKLKVSSPEILKPKSNIQIIERSRPYAFIGAIQPDAFMTQGNKYPMWKGHLISCYAA
jgi:hypothetical protein